MSATTLAQQAMDILETRGEYAMQPFLMNAADPSTTSQQDWFKNGQLILEDGSWVEHTDMMYYAFHWYEPGADTEECVLRASAMPPAGRPSPRLFTEPVLAFPSQEEVVLRIVHTMERRLGLDLEEASISNHEAFRASPSLYEALGEAVQNFDATRYIEMYEDNILTVVALDAINRIGPEEATCLDRAVAKAAETMPQPMV